MERKCPISGRIPDQARSGAAGPGRSGLSGAGTSASRKWDERGGSGPKARVGRGGRPLRYLAAAVIEAMTSGGQRPVFSQAS